MNPNFEMLEQALGRLHPAFVHFPIALFLVAGVLELFNLKRSRPSHVALVCLAFGVGGAAIAAYSGWERAEFEAQGASVEELLFRHRWCAIGGSVSALLALIAGSLTRKTEGGGKLRFYRGALFLAVGLVSYVGFLGGQMVYGVGYVTEVFEERSEPVTTEQSTALPDEQSAADKDSEVTGDAPDSVVTEAIEERGEPVVPADQSTGLPDEEPAADMGSEVTEEAQLAAVVEPVPARISFTAQVLPIFERACFECHGPTGKSRGGLRLHEREPLFEGAKEFWIILPEDSDGSYLMELINLPPGDPDIMPKDGEPLAPEEIKLLADWIDQGARWE